MKRFLFLLERALFWLWIRRWPEKLPSCFEEIWAGVLLVLINALRRERFGTPHHCGDCEECGLLFPLDDLQQVVKSDGNAYPECVDCKWLGDLIRSIQPRPWAA